MGKVLNVFGYGSPGAITRSVDDIVISVRNASGSDIAFGDPVFMTENGAVPFSTDNPQEFADFLGFACGGQDAGHLSPGTVQHRCFRRGNRRLARR